MKTILFLLAALSSTAAFAASDCRIVEYKDHFEAVCSGRSEQTAPPAASDSQPQEPAAVQEQPEIPVIVVQEQADGEPVIVRSELARRHAEMWLASQPR
jgi:hypothetical protein